MSYIVYPILFFTLTFSSIAFAVNILCTVDFCETSPTVTTCTNVPDECYNATLARVIPSLGECSCCEHCLKFKNFDDDCVEGAPGLTMPGSICADGLICRNQKCKKMIREEDDPALFPTHICKNGTCNCIAPERNKAGEYIDIFGTFQDSPLVKNETQCGCSRYVYKAMKQINRVLPYPALQPTVRCLPNGQFDPLQCINSICGCVEKETGVWDEALLFVPVVALAPKNPRCFDNSLGHQRGIYYKPCENERNKLIEDLDMKLTNGSITLFTSIKTCSPTGDYDE